MRCLYVGADVSPMGYDVALATVLIKLVPLSYRRSASPPRPDFR